MRSALNFLAGDFDTMAAPEARRYVLHTYRAPLRCRAAGIDMEGSNPGRHVPP